MTVSRLCFFPYFNDHLIRKSFSLKISLNRLLFKETHFLANQVVKKNVKRHFDFSKKILLVSQILLINVINKSYEEKMQPAENSKPPSPPVNSKGDREKYEALLIEQIESIRGWNGLFEGSQRAAVIKFMNAIGHLYLDYYQFHLDEAKACGLKCKSLLESSVDSIITYTINLEHRLRSADAMDEPWEMACWGRTNIEALISMFGELVQYVDSVGIDEYMQDRKGTAYLSGDLIPENAPLSHWWWFENF